LQNLTHATDTLAMSTPNATTVKGVQPASVMMGTWGTANIAKVSFFSPTKVFLFFQQNIL